MSRAYEDDAVAAEAEYGGKFRQPMTAYLERAVVEKAVDVGVAARTKLPGVTYLAFVDVAGGGGRDSYTCAIGHKRKDDGRDIAVVDAIFEVRPEFDPDEVTARCVAVLRWWGVNFIIGDNYASMWPVTAFARHGVTYQAAPLSASDLYRHVIPLWTAGRVAMLDHPRAIDQLCQLRRKVGQGGRETITHVGGSHDDIANSIAGLLWRLSPVEAEITYAAPIVVTSGNRELAPGHTGVAPGLQGAIDRVFAEERRLHANERGFW